jgi:DNA-directed RNA polymerase subunit RPC12/RpoP
MTDNHVCKKCNQEFLWIQGNPQQLSQMEQLICAKENLPFAIMKKITCPYCGTQSLAQDPAR